MYVGSVDADVSDKLAFRNANAFVVRASFPLNSVRLAKYYSSRKILCELGEGVDR